MRVGDKIKLLRAKNQWTQKELSQRLECAQSTVSDMEKGSLIDTVMKVKLSEVFDMPLDYFEELIINKNVSVPNRMIVEDLLDTLIARGTIKDPNNIDKTTLDMLVQVLKKDIEDKLKKQP